MKAFIFVLLYDVYIHINTLQVMTRQHLQVTTMKSLTTNREAVHKEVGVSINLPMAPVTLQSAVE